MKNKTKALLDNELTSCYTCSVVGPVAKLHTTSRGVVVVTRLLPASDFAALQFAVHAVNTGGKRMGGTAFRCNGGQVNGSASERKRCSAPNHCLLSASSARLSCIQGAFTRRGARERWPEGPAARPLTLLYTKHPTRILCFHTQLPRP